MPATITEIETLTKTLADARQLLCERVTALHEELTDAKRRKLPGIKSAVAAAKEAGARLDAEIAASPELFAEPQPRTIIVHGIRVGFAKGRGKIVWADEKTVVARIKEHFPKQKDVLIKTVESVRKKALGALDVAALRKIGCTVIAAGDAVYIAPVADEVDKLISRLLDEETTTAGEE